MNTETNASDGSEDPALDDHLGIEISSRLKARVRAKAGLRNQNMSEYLRSLLDAETSEIPDELVEQALGEMDE